MLKNKVFVIGGAIHYLSAFPYLRAVSFDEADIFLFTGGADVDPAFYNEDKHPTTLVNARRDVEEMGYFQQAVVRQIPMIGICRGAQFLCVMNGGKLIQNIDKHAIYGTHSIQFVDSKEEYQITSTHHQMMYPQNLPEEDYEVLAVASPKRATFYQTGRGEVSPKYEYEIVYFPKTKSYCIQGHPEMIPRAAIVEKLKKELYGRKIVF